MAIALTSTALGTLLPILKDSGLLATRFGATLIHHGASASSGRSSRWRSCWAPAAPWSR